MNVQDKCAEYHLYWAKLLQPCGLHSNKLSTADYCHFVNYQNVYLTIFPVFSCLYLFSLGDTQLTRQELLNPWTMVKAFYTEH